MARGEGLLRSRKKKKRMGGRRRRGTNAKEGRTIKSTLCLINDISLYQVDRLGKMMLLMTNALGHGGGEGKVYANVPRNKMDNKNNAIASTARALCTFHDDNHPPIIDCNLILERIFGMEGIKIAMLKRRHTWHCAIPALRIITLDNSATVALRAGWSGMSRWHLIIWWMLILAWALQGRWQGCKPMSSHRAGNCVM